MLQGISDHYQLGSATWTGGNSRRLKEAGGPKIFIFGDLWPLSRPDNINVGITVSFFSFIFFLFHSWTISQICCIWKQNVSSHPVQHQADCLHKARQMPVHRSPLTSVWIPVMLVYLLTQLQTTISHRFGSWKIILCQSGAGVSMWVHFSEWKIIIFNYMELFLKVSFLTQGWSCSSEQRRKNRKDCSCGRKVAWPRVEGIWLEDWLEFAQIYQMGMGEELLWKAFGMGL